jgi:hypothetical protein
LKVEVCNFLSDCNNSGANLWYDEVFV